VNISRRTAAIGTPPLLLPIRVRSRRDRVAGLARSQRRSRVSDPARVGLGAAGRCWQSALQAEPRRQCRSRSRRRARVEAIRGDVPRRDLLAVWIRRAPVRFSRFQSTHRPVVAFTEQWIPRVPYVGGQPGPDSSRIAFRLVDRLRRVVEILENNGRFVNTSPCGEPQLGRRGLYRKTGGGSASDRDMAMLWTLNLSDGAHSLLEIADRAGLDFGLIVRAADELTAAGLLTTA